MPSALESSIAGMIPTQSVAALASVRIAERTSRTWLTGARAAVDAFSASAAAAQMQQRSLLALSKGSMASAAHLSVLGEGAAAASARQIADLVGPTSSLAQLANIVGTTSSLSRMANMAASMPELRSAGLAGLVSAADAHRPWAVGISDQVKFPVGLAGAFDAVRLQADHFSSVMPDFNRLWGVARPQLLGISEAVASMSAQFVQPLAALGQLGLRAVKAAIAFGERVYFAVLAAQEAAARGDFSAVDALLRERLELPRSRWPERVQAGMDVLIDTRLEEYGPDTAFELLEVLQKQANHHFRRGCLSLEETKLNRRWVVSIDALPGVVGRPDRPSEHFLPASRSAEDRALFVLNHPQDDRLEAVLGSLTPEEVRVVWAKEMAQTSWQNAAVMCGFREQEGERVRAKVNRRAKQVATIATRPSSSAWR